MTPNDLNGAAAVSNKARTLYLQWRDLLAPMTKYDDYTSFIAFQAGLAAAGKQADAQLDQHHRDSAELRKLCEARDAARRTAEYWKAEHLAGNKKIAQLYRAVGSGRILLAACNRLWAEAEEIETPDGLAQVALQQYWDAFIDARDAATNAIFAINEPATHEALPVKADSDIQAAQVAAQSAPSIGNTRPCGDFKCEAAQGDGVLCSDDSCDIATGVRAAPAKPANGADRG